MLPTIIFCFERMTTDPCNHPHFRSRWCSAGTGQRGQNGVCTSITFSSQIAEAQRTL